MSMTVKTSSQISEARIRTSMRARFNRIKLLTRDSLSRMLGEFSRGYLSSTAITWESKRKRSVARLNWEILTIDRFPEAIFQKQALEYSTIISKLLTLSIITSGAILVSS
jgi:hypothetical protein